jgi:hypothetical protein
MAALGRNLFFIANKKQQGSDESKMSDQSVFDFCKAFPLTTGQVTNGKFRWIQYKTGILRILVGRATGRFHRDFDDHQVLKEWKTDFCTMHELLCAVESSWSYQREKLTADTFLDEFDVDLGPSNPDPIEPVCLGTARDAVVINHGSDLKKLVTALAIAAEADGKMVLYSGHDDGTLAKWSLDCNTEVWSRQAYVDHHYSRYREYACLHVDYTNGVAGIVVRFD